MARKYIDGVFCNSNYVENVFVTSTTIYYIQAFRSGSFFRFKHDLENYLFTLSMGGGHIQLDRVFGYDSKGITHNGAFPVKTPIPFTAYYKGKHFD